MRMADASSSRCCCSRSSDNIRVAIAPSPAHKTNSVRSDQFPASQPATLASGMMAAQWTESSIGTAYEPTARTRTLAVYELGGPTACNTNSTTPLRRRPVLFMLSLQATDSSLWMEQWRFPRASASPQCLQTQQNRMVKRDSLWQHRRRHDKIVGWPRRRWKETFT